MSFPSLPEFTEKYIIGTDRNVVHIDAARNDTGLSPFIVIHDGDRTVIVNPMTLEDHLCVDLCAFDGDDNAALGVFGMTNGQRASFDKTGETSHGWPATAGVSVLLGRQGTDD